MSEGQWIERTTLENWVDRDTEQMTRIRELEAENKALREGRGVKVKPLEWLGGGGRHHAGDYVIEDISYGQREVRRLLRASFGTTYVGDFSGEKPLAAAKAAAQADYERRILSALDLKE